MSDRSDWPSWDPFQELAPTIEWLEELSPECRDGIKRLSAVMATAVTGNDVKYADRLLEMDGESGPKSDNDEVELMWRWYQRGLIIAAGKHIGRLIHTESTIG